MNTGSIPRAAAVISIATAVAALVGWQFDIPVLVSVIPGRSTMNPTTAVALILLGASLWIARTPGWPEWTRSGGRVAAGLVALLGLVVLASYAVGSDLDIHRLFLSQRTASSAAGLAARISAATGLSLFLIGSAIALMNAPARFGRPLAHAAAIPASIVALLAFTGHAFGATFEPGLVVLRPMALNTAVAILALSTGVIAALPEYGLAALLHSDTPGGALVRQLLPSVLLIPILLYWLRIRGEQAGWFDRAGGRALLLTALVVVLGAISWRSAILLNRADSRRRLAERALRESDERYRLLFDINPQPGWVYDLETLRFLIVNDAAVRHYGYTVDEFRAMTIRDIRPPEEVPRLVERLAQLRADPEYHGGGTWRHRTKDGSLLEVEITSHQLTFEGRPAEMVLAQDVTERRRAEAALRASEEQFRTLAATANEAIVSADARGNITYVNPAAEQIFGHGSAEVVGRQLTVLMPERFREAHLRGFERYLTTGEQHLIGRGTVELVGARRDGSEFPVELSLASWRRGDELAFTAVIRDVTARKEAEDALRRYAGQLEVANAELDAFAHSVSHDLRAPLRSIDGFSLALLEDYADSVDETGRDYLRRVRLAAQRMALLIDDLLGLSRVTRAPLERQTVDLSALAEGVLSDLRERDHGRIVDLLVAPGLSAEGDPRLLRLLLENLLGNAWKYTAKKERAHIEFGAVQADGGRAYFVRDDGAGFDMTYAGKLFGAFQRLHSLDEFEGTGIGLATVQRIVHRHGGRVWAEGALGRGATFYFTL